MSAESGESIRCIIYPLLTLRLTVNTNIAYQDDVPDGYSRGDEEEIDGSAWSFQ